MGSWLLWDNKWILERETKFFYSYFRSLFSFISQKLVTGWWMLHFLCLNFVLQSMCRYVIGMLQILNLEVRLCWCRTSSWNLLGLNGSFLRNAGVLSNKVTQADIFCHRKLLEEPVQYRHKFHICILSGLPSLFGSKSSHYANAKYHWKSPRLYRALVIVCLLVK